VRKDEMAFVNTISLVALDDAFKPHIPMVVGVVI
jgi:hypothetical protein